MPTPQPGVLAAGSLHAYFLTFTTSHGGERSAWIKAIRDILPRAKALAIREKRAGLFCTFGIGSDLWDRLSPGNRP